MDKKPGKTKRGQFVTNQDYERVEYIIYNNLSLPFFQEQHIKGPKQNKKALRTLLIPGEKYVEVPVEGYEHIFITSYGRAINSYRISVLTPAVTSNNFIYYLGGTNVNSSNVFAEMGWKHDMLKLIRRYNKNQWKYSPKSQELKDQKKRFKHS